MIGYLNLTEDMIRLHASAQDREDHAPRTPVAALPAEPEPQTIVVSVDPMDEVTVCITSFRRTKHLARCLESLIAAGIKRVVVAAAEPPAEVLGLLAEFQEEYAWTSFDVAVVDQDIGCNDLWALAAYRSRTERVIIMHDDDCLRPGFDSTYIKVVRGPLNSGAVGFVTWRASLLFDDGSTQGTEFFSGPTRKLPSMELASKVLLPKNRLSLSPVISILNRSIVIDACKESFQKLTFDDSYERPGMLLGTELVVYQRHCSKYPDWLYVDEVLSHYGSHIGSGTVRAQQEGHTWKLIAGYNRARDLWGKPVGDLDPKIIFVYWQNPTADPDEILRNRNAELTWKFHFNASTMIELHVKECDVARTSCGIGDTRSLAYVRDLFDHGCKYARPQDIVIYCNRDIGLTVGAYDRLVEGVKRGNGVTVCPRRRIDPFPGRMYRDLRNCWPDGGFDVMAVTPAWWKQHRMQMPDMLIGREAWDTVFRTLAEEWADKKPQKISLLRLDWQNSNAYTDHVAWHKNHYSEWIKERLTAPGQLYNRSVAAAFFKSRGNHNLVRELQPQ